MKGTESSSSPPLKHPKSPLTMVAPPGCEDLRSPHEERSQMYKTLNMWKKWSQNSGNLAQTPKKNGP